MGMTRRDGDGIGDPPSALAALAAGVAVPLFMGVGSCRCHCRDVVVLVSTPVKG